MPHLIRHYIGGCFVESEKRFANINPVDGSLVCEVCEASRADVDAAVAAARAALGGPGDGYRYPSARIGCIGSPKVSRNASRISSPRRCVIRAGL